MTDFRTLIQHNDLRSQLGLVPGRRAAELSEVIGDALRIDPKPLNPANATPDPLHRTIAAMGCSSKTWALRNALAVNKLFSSTSTSNVVVNVTNNGEPPTDKDASEIVANIRKMIDSPEVQLLRQVGEVRKFAEVTAKIDAAAPAHRHLSKIHNHVETVESDILEMLAMAGDNPHADRLRLDAARTQFELAFMMMKKAVDPEQERE